MKKSSKSNASTKSFKEAILVFSLAITAAIFIKLPVIFGIDINQNEQFYLRNFSLFVLPSLAAYFVWKRKIDNRLILMLVMGFVAAILFTNLYPFRSQSDTAMLAAIHLPISLWLLVGIAYTGGQWNESSRRMDFIRFSGELFIYYVLIALGGGVLMALMVFIFHTITIDIEPIYESWVVPCGSVGAVIIASWMVEIKKGAVENVAPMLSRIFTPLFTIVLLTFLGTLIWTGRTMEIEREVLIALDVLLVLVLGLLLYSISTRSPESNPGFFDLVRILLLVSALLVDLIAMWNIGGRIAELGFTPNRIVALGINVTLFVNLSWSVVIYIRFLLRQRLFEELKKWQTDYLPVYAIWATVVVVTIPPLFNYI